MDEVKGEPVSSANEFSSTSPPNLAKLPHPAVADMPEPNDLSRPGIGAESVELGSFDLVDAMNAALVAARPKPRGLLPVPPEVDAAIAEDEAALLRDHGVVPTLDDRERQVNSLTLQYFYGGQDVAYRVTPHGVELLAAGLTEIGELVRAMSQEELLTLKIGQP
jgi:hypothetical protein